MDEIWELQSYLLSEADAAGTVIIQNEKVERTIQEMLSELSRTITKRFPPDLSSVEWGQ